MDLFRDLPALLAPLEFLDMTADLECKEKLER